MENFNTDQQPNSELVLIEDNVPYSNTLIVADKLGVQHGPFMANTVLKYQEQVEAKCGQVHFKNRVGHRPQGGGNPERYALLTELQTNAYLGLVRNTPQSVELKIDFAVAFDGAKKIIDQLINQKSLQGKELDFWTILRNPQLRRQKIELNEDIMLSLRKETACLKYIEEKENPELVFTRGKRRTPRVITISNGVQVVQLQLCFENRIRQ